MIPKNYVIEIISPKNSLSICLELIDIGAAFAGTESGAH